MKKLIFFFKTAVSKAKNIKSSYFVIILLLLTSSASFVNAQIKEGRGKVGHPWSQIGDGNFSIVGPTQMRTFNFPDYDASILTNKSIIGPEQGGTGLTSVDREGTKYLSNKGPTGGALWSEIDLTTGIKNILPLSNGGTGSNLLPTNGGIVYSNEKSLAITDGPDVENKVLLSGKNSVPVWSTSKYPSAAGAIWNILVSNGADWESKAEPRIETINTRSLTTTGAAASLNISSNGTFRVGLFTVPVALVFKKVSVYITNVASVGALRMCIYNESGDLQVGGSTSNFYNNGTLSATFDETRLQPGNYYIAIGCVGNCNVDVSGWASTSFGHENGMGVPSGQKAYEGLTFMGNSGACNQTLGSITPGSSNTVNARLDN